MTLILHLGERVGDDLAFAVEGGAPAGQPRHIALICFEDGHHLAHLKGQYVLHRNRHGQQQGREKDVLHAHRSPSLSLLGGEATRVPPSFDAYRHYFQ
jgi:hypothetical protein